MNRFSQEEKYCSSSPKELEIPEFVLLGKTKYTELSGNARRQTVLLAALFCSVTTGWEELGGVPDTLSDCAAIQ